jgi:hypothetical protein
MSAPASEQHPVEPGIAWPRPSTRYWAGLALFILALLGVCGALIIIAALHG